MRVLKTLSNAIALAGLLIGMSGPLAVAEDMGLRKPLPEHIKVIEGLADLGNVRLWYWDTGGVGEVIVLLHPGSGSAETFPYQQASFAKAGYRVISYSRRGQFKSEMGNNWDSFSATDDLLALMDYLKVTRFHVVGSALGGYLALDVAISHSDRVQSLVLASSMMGIDEPEYIEILRLLRPKPFNELQAEVREVGPSYRAANPSGLAEWNARHERAGKSAPLRKKNKVTWQVLAALKVPTLLMTGDADLWIPPYLLRQVARKIPDSQVVIVPDTGHAIHWEKPDAFDAVVLKFISERVRH